MSTSPIMIRPWSRGFALLEWLLDAAATTLGATVVAILGCALAFANWVAWSDTWVFFFLAAKPLIDLTWRLEFMEIVHQRVNPQAIVALFVVLLNGMALTLGRRKPQHYRRVLLLLSIATFSVAVTPTAWGVNELIRLFAGVSFFFSAGPALIDKRRFDSFSILFLAILCIPLFLSLLQVAGVLPFEYWDWLDNQEVGRASGTYQHPLEVVFFLAYAVPLGLYRWENSTKGGAERAFLLAFFLLAFSGLVFTFHRTGWIAIPTEVAIWFGLRRQMKRILLPAVALVLLAASFGDWVSLLYRPATEIVQGEVDFESGNFLRGRGANWMIFLVSYANGGPMRWVVGRGGSVADASIGGIVEFSENEPHNDFIRILHAYGLAGLFLYLGILLLFLRRGLQLRSSRCPFESGVGRILVCSLVGVFLLSVTAEPMRYPTAIWYLFAFGSVAMFLNQDQKAAPHAR
jgi:O-antigen ligase